ncbi:MAG: RNA-binding S4 domain-containing protein [Lysobacteraceae bacterium]|nr:MAG: RNA-binding S4 domain-containing protein [Xanthomonadaceae bacterium]
MNRMDFELDRDHVELNQLLKLTGVCDSGGAGKALVASGEVQVDGITELRKTRKIRIGNVVTLEGIEIHVSAAVDPA